MNRRAIRLVRRLLRDGPVLSRQVYAAGVEQGFGRNVMLRAAHRLGVEFEKQGWSGGWSWQLPEDE